MSPLLAPLLTSLLFAAPQGKRVLIADLENVGAEAGQVRTVRDAIAAELKTQGYEALRTEAVGPADAGLRGANGVITGAVVKVGTVFELTLRLSDAASKRIVAASRVRCGAVEKLAEAAREASSQLASEARESWGMRTKFVPGPR